MPIELAPPDDLEVAEAAHKMRENDPEVSRQIDVMLKDSETLKLVAQNHSSLLVRKLARRLLICDTVLKIEGQRQAMSLFPQFTTRKVKRK